MEQDPLSQLRDIHIPPPEGFWPPAPGWWFVLLLVIGLAIAITVWLRRRRQKNAWYRIARRRLDRLAEGDPNLDIARRLGMEEREVKYLVRSILTKLHFNNRTEAGVFALRFRESLRARQRSH